jgi:hypothetical protein
VTIRVCPIRDAACPHGMSCPYTIDRYTCMPEPREPPHSPPLQSERERIARIIFAEVIPSIRINYAPDGDPKPEAILNPHTVWEAADAILSNPEGGEKS